MEEKIERQCNEKEFQEALEKMLNKCKITLDKSEFIIDKEECNVPKFAESLYYKSKENK